MYSGTPANINALITEEIAKAYFEQMLKRTPERIPAGTFG